MSTTVIPWVALVLAVSIPMLFIAGSRYYAQLASGRPRSSLVVGPDLLALPTSITVSRASLRQLILVAMLGLGPLVVLRRFVLGIGAASNLSDQFPWGIWIGFDVMGGVALAAGAFVIAGMAHIFGVRRLEPLVRPAILTGFLGYLLVICALVVDLGRPYNIWQPLVHWQHNSVMWEVGMCVVSYTAVLFIEFLPIVLERINGLEAVARRLPTLPLYRLLRKVSIVFVILGVILSTLHQSSLGSLWLLVPTKLHPLWYSIYLPVFFWLSAIAAGLAMVIVESSLSARAFGHGLKPRLLADLGRWSAVVLAIYLAAKAADLVQRGAWPSIFRPSAESAAFGLEIGLGIIVPMILFAIPAMRRRPRVLFTGAMLVVVFGVALNRLNVSVVGMWAASGEMYLPSWMEVAVTVSLITYGVGAFALAAKHLPVFPDERAHS